MWGGVFDLLLAWSALFAGFLPDERKNKPNMLRIGIHVLTSGVSLPCLFARTHERDTHVYKEDIGDDLLAEIEKRGQLGAFLGTVGTG